MTWLDLYSFYFFAASSLKCYKCKGPDDGRPYPKSICENELTEVTCASDNYTCGIYHHEIKSGALVNEVEGRSCVHVADCRDVESPCRVIRLAGGNCTFSCCDEDLCNTATKIIPQLLLIAGAFVSVAVYMILIQWVEGERENTATKRISQLLLIAGAFVSAAVYMILL